MAKSQLLYAWVGQGLSVLVPKRRGRGFLRAPYGHHNQPALNAIADLAGCDVFGLGGSLDFQVPGDVYHGGQLKRAEFAGRLLPALEKVYEAKSREITAADFWQLHPLKTVRPEKRLFGKECGRCLSQPPSIEQKEVTMAYCKSSDPGKVSAWRRRVSEGVKRSQRKCPKCERSSSGGTVHFVDERVTVWRCRYCGHEQGKTW